MNVPSRRRALRAGLITVMAALVAPADVTAQTLRVSTSGLDGNSGLTWSTSLRTLQSALSRAAADPSITRIEVAAGTYKPGGSRSSSFQLVSGVAVVGGYPPTGGATADPDLFPTILSGDIGVDGNAADNCYTVVIAFGVTGARLEGFRIRHGNSDGATTGPFAHGGGLYTQNSSFVVLNCRFHENLARIGGAVSLWSTAATFSDCWFTDNSAGSGGGAIASTPLQNPCDVLVDRCRFLGNFGQSYGGAIWNVGNMAIHNSIFSGNESLQYGGAICSTATADITRVVNCSLANNRAAVAGGAFYDGSTGGRLLVNSIFWHNTGAGASTEIAPAGSGLVHHCTVQGLAAAGLAGYANADSDPEFVDELGSDGVAGTSDDDLHIRPWSPCVSAGDNAAVPIYAMLDIDDEARIQRKLPYEPAIVDVGADEIDSVQVLYPGSEVDLDLRVEVDGSRDGIGGTDAMAVPGGSRLELVVRSPEGTFAGMPCAITLDLFLGSSPPSWPGLPDAYFGMGAYYVMFPALSAAGESLVFDPMPSGFVLTFMAQGLVLDESAANGLFWGSRGRELRLF
jgi:predicted outer membrane repeat protein